jgi:hypothetical protein
VPDALARRMWIEWCSECVRDGRQRQQDHHRPPD